MSTDLSVEILGHFMCVVLELLKNVHSIRELQIY